MIILKLGGSIITEKESQKPKVNYENLKRIAKEIKDSNVKDLILVHGAGSYGHQIVKRTGIHKGIKNKEQLLDFAETQRLQNELNTIITKELILQGLPAMPMQASKTAIMNNKKLVHMDTRAIQEMIKIRLIPVLYGVPAFDEVQKCSILSGDEIISYLTKKIKVDKIIHGTDVDGIYTEDPNKNPEAKLIKEITKENIHEVNLTGSSKIDVTGGMMKKVNEIINLGIETRIINANTENNILKTLQGESIGTRILF